MTELIQLTVSSTFILGAVYLGVATILLTAGVVDRMRFVRPRYWEVVIIAVIWPIWCLQIPYYWVTGRYLVNDIKRLFGMGDGDE